MQDGAGAGHQTDIGAGHQVPPVAQDVTGQQDGGQATGGSEDTGVTIDMVNKLKKDRSHANREAQAAKKEIDALRAQLQGYEDEKKSDLEKAEAKAARAQAELERMTAENNHLSRRLVVQASGVDPRYVDYVATELGKAMDKDGELNTGDWLSEFKSGSPAFFGVSSDSTLPTGGGGPGGPAGSGSAVQELKLVEDEIKALSSSLNRSDAVEAKLMGLRMKRNRLKTALLAK